MSNYIKKIVHTKLLKTGFVANDKGQKVPGLSCYITYVMEHINAGCCCVGIYNKSSFK